MAEWFPLIMFTGTCLFLMLGYPVAFTLAGSALFFAALGVLHGSFDPTILGALSERLFGIMTNGTLVAVPLFILMGVVLEKSRIAEDLLENMAKSFGQFPGGLGISVVLVGALMAASTGIVGATVVTLGLISLPSFLKQGYKPSLATGVLCATGTLGQIIPPSIALVLLGDVLSSAYQQAQLNLGHFSAKTVSVGDLFVGALLPGLLLVGLYLIYLCAIGLLKPEHCPPLESGEALEEKPTLSALIKSFLPPLLLIFLVLGSILSGAATPTEAAGVGAIGSLLLAAYKKQLSKDLVHEACLTTTKITAMVFMILIGASLFSLVFRGFGGDHQVEQFFNHLPGGVFSATLLVMAVIFLLGFILDFIEITFVVVPIVGPILMMMGLDPIWLGVMIAINLQTSFLTPPFGFALFYLRGVTPESIPTKEIYKGVTPFIGLQILLLILLALWPELATWLPGKVRQ